MNLSLEIIKNQWNQQFQTEFYPLSSEPEHIYYRSVRFLTEDLTVLHNDTIYVVPDQDQIMHISRFHQKPDLTIEEGTALLYTISDTDPGEESVISNDDDTVIKIRSLYDRYHIKKEKQLEICLVKGHDAMETFNRLLTVYEFYDEYDKLLMEALNEDNALQSVVNLICELVGNPAYVVDLNYRALAMDQSRDLPFFSIYWKRIRENGFLPYNTVSSILSNPEWDVVHNAKRPILMQTKEFASRFVTCNIWVDHRIQWRLFITETLQAISPADLDLAELLVDYLRHALLSDLKYTGQGAGSHELFLREAAAGTILSSQFLSEQLEPFKWKLEDRYCLLEIRTQAFDGYLRRYIDQTLRKKLDCHSFSYEDRFLLIISMSTVSGSSLTYDKVDMIIRKELSAYTCSAVLSNDFFGFQYLPVYLKQTEELMNCLSSCPSETSYLNYRDSYIALMSQALHNKDLEWAGKDQDKPVPYLVDRARERANSMKPGFLQALIQYDRIHKSELYKTLHQYISHDRNLVQTARVLHIHRNTLVYRLDQISQIIGEDLDDPHTRLLVWIAMEMM